MTKLHRSDLLDYLSREIFPTTNRGEVKKIGLELEMIPFHKGGNSPKRASFEELKEALKSYFSEGAWKEEKSFIYKKEGSQISFEPGGQIEFSSKPYASLDSLKKKAEEVEKGLSLHLEKKGIELLSVGVDPWNKLDEIGLQLQAPRYQKMQEHFLSLEGSLGRHMMLATAAIQVCLDFRVDAETQVKRYLLSQFLAPYASAIFANSPFSEGTRTAYESFRSQVWVKLDKSRAGFPFQKEEIATLSREECLESYLDFVLDSHLILYEGKYLLSSQKPSTFREWMNSPDFESPRLSDFETAMTLLFPEVRPKGFLELRSVDAQEFRWQMVPAVFFAGLLYQEEVAEEAFDLLKVKLGDLRELKKKSRYGLQDPLVLSRSQALMKLALRGFEALLPELGGERCLEDALRFSSKFTEKGLTPASFLENSF